MSWVSGELDVKCMRNTLRKWNVRYAVLFGSTLQGYSTQLSDLDIAVKLSRRLSPTELGLLYGELGECSKRAIDLTILNEADPILLWEVLVKGKLIYYEDESAISEYYYDKAMAIDMICDLEYLLKVFRRERLRRLQAWRQEFRED